MPNEPRNKHGRTLREQVRAAAQATAEQERAMSEARSAGTASKADGAGAAKKQRKATSSKDTDPSAKAAGSKAGKGGKVTKRQASKEQTAEAKKQDKSAKEREKRSFIETVRDGFLEMGLGLRIALGAIALLVLAVAVLYPIGCTYYQALRDEQRLEAELEAVNERNAQLEEENKQLETDEGVENQARQEYGWVKDGEKATVVTNSDDEEGGDLPAQVDGSKIEPPHTWYYDILDVVFRADV